MENLLVLWTPNYAAWRSRRAQKSAPIVNFPARHGIFFPFFFRWMSQKMHGKRIGSAWWLQHIFFSCSFNTEWESEEQCMQKATPPNVSMNVSIYIYVYADKMLNETVIYTYICMEWSREGTARNRYAKVKKKSKRKHWANLANRDGRIVIVNVKVILFLVDDTLRLSRGFSSSSFFFFRRRHLRFWDFW